MLKLLFALLLAVGAAVAALGLQLYRDDHAAADWVGVSATVVDLSVRSPSLPDPGPQSASVGGHIPLVVYEWEVDGQRYRSTRYRLGDALALAPSREAAQAQLAGYRIGQSLSAWHHPESPERAVLDRGGSHRGAWLGLLGAIMASAGVLGFWRAEQVALAWRRRHPG